MITEEMLVKAAFELDQAILDNLPDPSECVHIFSKAFERKMKKLIRRANHFVAYKIMRYAACIIVAFMISASMVLAFNTEARAAVVGWVKEKIENIYHYFFLEETDAEASASYKLEWVPEGYLLIDSIDSPSGRTCIYLNEEGDLLQFLYVYGSDSYSYTVGEDKHELKQVIEDGFCAEIILSVETDKTNVITWKSEDDDVIFTITGFLDEETLIKTAQSVTAEG